MWYKELTITALVAYIDKLILIGHDKNLFVSDDFKPVVYFYLWNIKEDIFINAFFLCP